MTKLETLRDLLARVERATGLDRELDLEFHWHLDCMQSQFSTVYRETLQGREVDVTYGWQKPADWRPWFEVNHPSYTASIDAAVTLVARVMPGWIWSVASEPGNKFEGELHEPWSYYGLGKGCGQMRGPALALCAALLKVLIAQAQTRHHAIDEMVRVSQELDLP